jgi:hypothetical protein
MPKGMDALEAALDSAIAPARFFLRDDDAGWGDARLYPLLDCTERNGVPLDLAVIPQAAHAGLAQELCARIDAAPDLIGVHQHGFAHQNHETAERKCEFGGARNVDMQREDLSEGRQRLHNMFGSRLDSIFTPPWNRCSAATPALLDELGYSALSRDRSAPIQHALPELKVDVDWCKQSRLAKQSADDCGSLICHALALRIGMGAPIGLMLHHAEMNADDLALLDSLLKQLRPHTRVQFLLMRELFPRRELTRLVHTTGVQRAMS